MAPMMDWIDSGRIGATRHGPSHDCHRPTWPADPATHAAARVVLHYWYAYVMLFPDPRSDIPVALVPS